METAKEKGRLEESLVSGPIKQLNFCEAKEITDQPLVSGTGKKE